MKTGYVFSIGALSLVCTVAAAGYVQPAPVTIDFTNRVAQGDLLTARNSKNKFEFIGCGVRYDLTGAYMFCQAGLGPDPATEQIVCFSDNPNLLDAAKSISAFSYIRFVWDQSGNCTEIGNSTNSFYLPDFKR
jgi:hypothetical protein